MEERIDDALAFFQDYHFAASEKVYLKHQLTYSNLNFSTATTGTFLDREPIVGQTSKIAGRVFTQKSPTLAEFTYSRVKLTDTFTVGETVLGQTSGATGIVSSVQEGDWDKQVIPISDLVLNIYRIVKLDGFAVDRSTGLFSWNYQFLMNDLSWLSSSSVISYYLTRSHMEMLNNLFIGDVLLRFNKYSGKLYLDLDWRQDLKPGDWVVAEAQRIMNPAEYPKIWGDRFLRDYATALVKKQWGQNLIKYEGIQMPGGVTLNGRVIYDEGNREATQLEETIQAKFEIPPEFIVMGLLLPIFAFGENIIQNFAGIMGIV